MSTKVHSEQNSGGDVETVYALLTSEEWPARKDAALDDGSTLVRRDEKPDGGVTMVVSRALPKGIPGFLQKFAPEGGRVTQTDDWGPAEGGVRRGTWHVDMPGAPARLGGTMRLEPTADGSRYVIDGECTVKVPLVGGKAESFIASMVEKLGRKEAEVLRSALAR